MKVFNTSKYFVDIYFDYFYLIIIALLIFLYNALI